jgi:hypothetical protein
MAFESLEPYRVRIETMLAAGDSVSAIAKKLGIPEKRRLINLYKNERFNVREAAQAVLSRIPEETTQDRLDGAVRRVVAEHDGIKLGMQRGMELMELDADGDYPVASALWAEGMKIFSSAVKLKMEIAGDDPTSRVAVAIEEWGENELREFRDVLLAERNRRCAAPDEP